MRIKLEEFTRAVAKIQAMASGEKTVPGIMLDIADDGLKICYSDGRKALIEKIDATIEEGDVRGKIVLDYGRVVSSIAICQPSGRLKIEELVFEFEQDGKVMLSADKMLLVKDDDDEEILTKVSKFEQLLTWVEAGANMKTSILSRENYGGIFNPSDGYDEWDANELRDILVKTSGEKGKQIYISPKQGQAFVCNMAYMTTIPVEDGYTFPIVIPTATGKCISDIISRLGVDKLLVHVVEGKYCKVYTEDGNFGMSFEIIPANRTHLSTLDRYQAKSYNGVQLTFLKEVLQNVIKSAMAVSASEKVNLKLVEDGDTGNIELLVVGSNTNASIENNYRVITNGFNFEEANGLDQAKIIRDFDIPISLKVLSDIIAKCDSDYVAFDVSSEDNSSAKAIRISDVDLNKVIEETRAVLGLERVEQKEEDQDTHGVTGSAAVMGETTKESTVIPIVKNGAEQEFEVEGVREDAVKTTKFGDDGVTMKDKVEFRLSTLTSKHYTLAAK